MPILKKYFNRFKDQFINIKLIYLNLYIFFFTAITLFSVILLATIYWPVSDDYWLYNLTKDLGIFGYVKYMYLNWDGRFFTLLLNAILFSIIKLDHIYILITIFVLLFIFLSFILAKFLKNLTYNGNLEFCDFSIVFFTLFLSLTPILREVLYWFTGGFYSLNALFAVIWIFLQYDIIFRERKIYYPYLTIPLFAIFSFFLGGSTQNLSISLVFFAIVFLIIAQRKTRLKPNLAIVIISLIFIVIGAIFIYIAPGNFIRSSELRGSFNLEFSVIFKNYGEALIYYFKIATKTIIFSTIGALILVIFKFIKNNWQINDFDISKYLKGKKDSIYFVFLLLFTGLVNLAPFALVPEGKAGRAGIYFLIFLLIFIWSVSYHLYFILINLILKYYKRIKYFFVIIFVILFGFMSISIISNVSKSFYYGSLYRDKNVERDLYLKNLPLAEKKEDITVEEIIVKKNGLLDTFEITKNKDDWKNKAVAEYYGIKSIRIYNKELKNFILNIYKSYLLENPGNNKLEFWKSALEKKYITVTDFIKYIDMLNSVSKKSDEEFLNLLYATFFERQPDNEGYKNWLELLKKGFSREKVLDNFINSDEFAKVSYKYCIIP